MHVTVTTLFKQRVVEVPPCSAPDVYYEVQNDYPINLSQHASGKCKGVEVFSSSEFGR